MKVVAVVPIKLNNVRTPGKNIRPLSDGTPLIHLIQNQLLRVPQISEVYVYCSNSEIKDYLLPNVKHILRNPEFDTPQADVIEMMRVFTEIVDADCYVQAHATTPFLSSDSISVALDEIQSKDYDSAFAVKRVQDFLWLNNKPVNYQLDCIPRTQDMPPYFMETTGLYIYKKEVIQNLHRRIGDNPFLLEVSEIEALDIDTPMDFDIVEAVYDKLFRK